MLRKQEPMRDSIEKNNAEVQYGRQEHDNDLESVFKVFVLKNVKGHILGSKNLNSEEKRLLGQDFYEN